MPGDGDATRITTLYEGVPGTAETTMYTAAYPTEVTSIRVIAEDSTGTTITVHYRRVNTSTNAVAAAAAGNVIYESGTITNATVETDLMASDQPLGMNPGDVLSAIEGSASHVLAVIVSGKVYGQA